MAIVGEKTTLKLVGVGALDDPLINKTVSPINPGSNQNHPLKRQKSTNG